MHRNRLLALIAQNSNRPRRFEAVAAAGKSTALYLYDIIDPLWGISASSFVKTLNSISTPQIDLHINSPGGDVFDGRAMASAIAAHPSNITAYVDGLAASAASFVALAANDVVMAPGSFMMIHNAWSIGYGNATDLRTLAALLEKIDGSLVEDYVRATGASIDQVKAWMDAETWFTAQEAVDAGLADSVSESQQQEEEAVSNFWDLRAYKRAPRSEGARWTACGARDLAIDKTTAWDGSSAGAAILDNAGIGGKSPNYQLAKDGFVFCDLSNPDDRGSFKEPFCVVVDGKLKASSAGVTAAKQRLSATDVPQKVREDGESLLKHYSDQVDAQNSAAHDAEHDARHWQLLDLSYA